MVDQRRWSADGVPTAVRRAPAAVAPRPPPGVGHSTTGRHRLPRGRGPHARRRQRRRVHAARRRHGRHRAPAPPAARRRRRGREVFADYEILQPFPQLGRDGPRADRRTRRGAPQLDRFRGATVPTGKVLGLEQARLAARRSRRTAGVQGWIERAAAGGGALIASSTRASRSATIDEFPEQRLAASGSTASGPATWRAPRTAPATFGELDPITASEILADLDVADGR